MKDLLRTLLTPADDGRAFTDAVLLRASGALHRRRYAEPASEPVWSLLERWAQARMPGLPESPDPPTYWTRVLSQPVSYRLGRLLARPAPTSTESRPGASSAF